MTNNTLKEYAIGKKGRIVDLNKLTAETLSMEIYTKANQGLVTCCHDVYISMPDKKGTLGLLLVKRKQEPMTGVFWPVGGRTLRGMPTEESLKIKAKKECGLELEDITFLGQARVFFEENSLGHGKGYDAFGFNYYAKGNGKLKLNDLHNDSKIITLKQYTSEFRNNLHPYMLEFMDKAMALIE